MDLEKLTTEQRNTKTMRLDEMTPLEIVTLMNLEDQSVPKSVQKVLPAISQAIIKIIASFNREGRLFYIGAGTSGRLGVLDAAECVPTFGTSPEMVQGLIAGGMEAMTIAVEGAEDSMALGREDLIEHGLNENDVVVGIAASGRTPYVIGGLDYANQIGATTIALSCNLDSEIGQHATDRIEVEVGPEILTGSTRLKSGTAQKLILNMLSTGAMIGIGKVYKNLMVDVKATNEKLIERSKRIIMQATDCDYQTADQHFTEANHDVKLAIIMILTKADLATARASLVRNKGFIRKCQTELI